MKTESAQVLCCRSCRSRCRCRAALRAISPAAVQIVEECYQNPFKRQFTSYGVLKVLSAPYLVPALLVATMRKW